MPQSPTVMETMTTLSISWERVECLQRNSEITGYRLFIISFYGTRIRNVTRMSSRNQTLTEMNLIPNTEYTIEIGAVNSNGGIGPNLTFNVTTRPAQGMKFSIVLQGTSNEGHSERGQAFKSTFIQNNSKRGQPLYKGCPFILSM